MNHTHSYLRYILILLAIPLALLYSSQLIVSAESTVPVELLVKYEQLPRSIAAVPVLPAEPDRAEYIAPSVQLLTFPEGTDLQEMQKQLEQKPFIQTVEPNYERHLTTAVNDPFFTQQWGLQAVKAERFWPLISKQKVTPVVAVIDSGIDRKHPDLTGRIATDGYNFVSRNNGPADDHGHGTNVAGVIAAKANNGIGISGITGQFDTVILPLKTAAKDGTSRVSDNIEAIDYAIGHHADIINISQGGPSRSTFEEEAIRRATAAGILIIASAGNDAEKGNPPMFPASYADTLSVGSVSKWNIRSAFSNYNDLVDITAPGEQIVTTGRNNTYSSVSGTSFSAPIVAGTAAMMKAVAPDLSVQQMKDLLTATATDLGPKGKDAQYGSGLLNADEIAKQLADRPIPVTGIKLDRTAVDLSVGGMISLYATVLPEQADNHHVTWSSSDPDVAIVNSSGTVTAESEGNAVVTATTEDGHLTASVQVTVAPDESFTGDFPDLDVDQSKIFSVKFNKAVDRTSMYQKYITISKKPDGSSRNLTGFQAKLNPDNHAELYVAPNEQWDPGTYYLIIHQGMMGADGKTLGHDVTVRFRVR